MSDKIEYVTPPINAWDKLGFKIRLLKLQRWYMNTSGRWVEEEKDNEGEWVKYEDIEKIINEL